MRKTILLLLICLPLVAFGGCGDDDAPPPSTSPPATEPEADPIVAARKICKEYTARELSREYGPVTSDPEKAAQQFADQTAAVGLRGSYMRGCRDSLRFNAQKKTNR